MIFRVMFNTEVNPKLTQSAHISCLQKNPGSKYMSSWKVCFIELINYCGKLKKKTVI